LDSTHGGSGDGSPHAEPGGLLHTKKSIL